MPVLRNQPYLTNEELLEIRGCISETKAIAGREYEPLGSCMGEVGLDVAMADLTPILERMLQELYDMVT